MIKLKHKSQKLRRSYKSCELKKYVLKNINTNSIFFLELRWKSMYFSDNEPKNCKKIKIKSRCLETTSRKTFNKKFKLSRLEFLRSARSGKISGFQKSVW